MTFPSVFDWTAQQVIAPGLARTSSIPRSPDLRAGNISQEAVDRVEELLDDYGFVHSRMLLHWYPSRASATEILSRAAKVLKLRNKGFVTVAGLRWKVWCR